MLRPLSIAALCLAGAVTLARADVYRWVDEHGTPHYSDQWMPGAEILKTRKTHPSGADTSARVADQRSLSAASQRISAQLAEQDNARAVQEDKAKRREVLCKQSRDAYARAIMSRRVYQDGEDGERTYLTDEQADTYREQLRKSVMDNCGSVPQFDPNAPLAEPQPIEPRPIPEPKANPAEAISE